MFEKIRGKSRRLAGRHENKDQMMLDCLPNMFMLVEMYWR